MAFGNAGVLAVFLVIPADIKLQPLEDLVKAMALALIGGYGGPALLQQVLSKTVLRKLEDEVQKREEQALKDAKALEMVIAYLDGEDKDEEELKEAIKSASEAQRLAIFQQARDVRSKNWRNDKPAMERTIPLFRALTESKGGSENHRYYGQLGYALKDKTSPDWKGARDALQKAIELRDKKGIQGFFLYDFNHAICEIKGTRAPRKTRKGDG